MTTLTGMRIESNHEVVRRLRTLYRYRELLWMLAWRDIRVRYKHSVLGAAWAVLPPLATMLIFTFVFGSVIDMDKHKLTGSSTLPYPLFAFSGLVPWMFFANGLTAAVNSLVNNRQLVTKIYFPREVFPLAAVAAALVDFLIASIVLVALAAVFHFLSSGWAYQFHWTVLLAPVVIGVQIALMVGMSLLLSMANLFYRDVGFIFRSVIQLWMFVTCVVYQLEATSGWKRAIIQLNPMTPIIRGYRDCLIMGRSPFDAAFYGAAAVSLAFLLVGWWWFRRREDDFAENI